MNRRPRQPNRNELGRPISGIALIAGGVMSQAWPPAFGVGLALYGACGVVFGELILVGPLKYAIRSSHAERILGWICIFAGAALAIGLR